MSENSQTLDPGAVKRTQAAQVRRRRAVELLGVSQDSVRRWQVRVRTGGVEALRRRRASGRPAKLADAQVEQVRDALVAGATAHGCDTDL